MNKPPDWPKIVQVLSDAKQVVVACHVNPDGDALGSLLGTILGLERHGATVVGSWAGPAGVPESYGFLPAIDRIVAQKDVRPSDVFLALDCGAKDRLGALARAASDSEVLINIDHHPGNPGFGTLNAVVPEASSTAELVVALLDDLGIELTADIAACLYAGVMTDTGRFHYSNATPATLELAARLRAYDFDATDMAQQIYESSPFGFLKLLGRMLDRAELFEKERFVFSYVTQADLAETNVDMSETDNLVDVVRSIREADVAAMLKEQTDGAWRVSLRSKGPISVGEIARTHGGGGHELAAGFTAESIEDAKTKILQALRQQAPTR
jgi:phosphoesterase RecJ-like protein